MPDASRQRIYTTAGTQPSVRGAKPCNLARLTRSVPERWAGSGRLGTTLNSAVLAVKLWLCVSAFERPGELVTQDEPVVSPETVPGGGTGPGSERTQELGGGWISTDRYRLRRYATQLAGRLAGR